ncbi:hypothetical protein D3C80_1645900 [compost metagenome]
MGLYARLCSAIGYVLQEIAQGHVLSGVTTAQGYRARIGAEPHLKVVIAAVVFHLNVSVDSCFGAP